jgi:APA family basic amino acid/polyamine antiporter
MFGKIHPKFQTPYIATIITGCVAAVIAGLFPIGLLGELVSIGTLLAFVIVSAGILVLRYRSPELHRPFRTPFVPFVPIMAILVCVGMMAALPGDTWLRLIIWMGLGLIIYFAYGKRNSKLGRAEAGIR